MRTLSRVVPGPIATTVPAKSTPNTPKRPPKLLSKAPQAETAQFGVSAGMLDPSQSGVQGCGAGCPAWPVA